MQLMVEYGVIVGAAWLTSNALFVAGWCRFHSRRKPWLHNGERTSNVFHPHRNPSRLGTGLESPDFEWNREIARLAEQPPPHRVPA